MADTARDRVVEAVKTSPFAHVTLRLPDYLLELSREAVEGQPRAAAVPVPDPRPTTDAAGGAEALAVRSPAPGVLHLKVGAAQRVADGDRLGYVQMHAQQVPLIAPATGVVGRIETRDGSFVGFGDPVLSLSAASDLSLLPTVPDIAPAQE